MRRPPSVDSCNCPPGHPAHDDSAIRIVYYDESIEVRPEAFLRRSASAVAFDAVREIRRSIGEKNHLHDMEIPHDIQWGYEMAGTKVPRATTGDKQRPYIAHARGYFAIATLHSAGMKQVA